MHNVKLLATDATAKRFDRIENSTDSYIGAICFEIYMYVQHRMRKLYIEKCLFISVIIDNFELGAQLWEFHYV